jgi:hypothetical protein
MAKQHFPRTIFVTVDPNADGEPEDNLLAYGAPIDGVDGNGPTVIAEYELKGVPKKYSKELVEN